MINRIIQQARPGGVEKLRRAVCEETIAPMIEAMLSSAGIAPDRVTRCAVAGNTTMEHLFVGADAESIRLEPYVPEFLSCTARPRHSCTCRSLRSFEVLFAPNVGSYVGGDITAGVLTTPMWHSDELSLFIDLGTNGELVFGNRDYMLCCACSAGPAFEGGDISCGMRATSGAIESCTIDPDTMEPSYTVVGDTAPCGVCGSGLIDTISELFRCGIISPKGKFIRDGRRVRRGE